MSKEKESKLSLAKQEAKTVIESFTQLITAVSLIITSGFSIYQGNQSTEFWAWPVTIAGSIIAVLAAIEFIKYLKRG